MVISFRWAKYCNVASESVVLAIIIVYSITPLSRKVITTWTTEDVFWSIATLTHITFYPCWLRIVFMATVVLPICLSLIYNSCWPHPIGIIESIAISPIWRGSYKERNNREIQLTKILPNDTPHRYAIFLITRQAPRDTNLANQLENCHNAPSRTT